ncbi:lysophospholipid acyltransferase family protein [Marinoscillum furvescens]|uniref:1-acyl-sn-glycerol-3-phosphate acyltransferase n=1 Tax=Marinoscillum furvescens DSM 4134 TaxID=1122208 RepID=A0A3D9KYQ0_MARFU|nr:lysophospholipid acyltransferase family protein [Marinoscillum furvescens]RED93857.1 1-acyl-sn-glycerol-3-phosphate acyltransferase [Marinoscillum furvescens DSM 4134]
MKKAFFSVCFRLTGWRVVGQRPVHLKKYVLIVAPHTSNWDFFVGVAARSISGLKSDFLAKDSLFKIPLVGWFLRKVGGHPVDRSRKMNMVDQVVELFHKHEEFVITITPEGTRSYNPNWKTGFYRIADKARVPIVLVGFDYEKRTVEYRKPFIPTGDLEKELEEIKAYFRTVKGKHPEKGVR